MLTRRRFLTGSAMLLGGAAVSGGRAFAIPRKIRIGVMAPSHCALPVLYAETQRMYKKAGLDVEVVYLNTVQQVVSGFQKRDLDFGQVIAPFALAEAEKTPMVAVQVLGTNGGALSVSSKQNITSIAGLKGKTIGVHSPYMIHNLILDYIMGMVQGKQQFAIKVVPMNEMARALKDNEIDGFIQPEPMPTSLELQGITRTLLTTKTFWTNHPCCLLTTRREVFQREKSMVSDTVRATMVAGLTLDQTKTRDKAIADVHRNSQPYQAMQLAALTKAFNTERTDFNPFLYHSSGIVIVNRLKSKQLLAQTVDSERLVNEVFLSDFALSILKEAAREVPGSVVPAGTTRQEQIRLS